MLVSLTSKLFDIAGAVVLSVPSPQFGDTRRRASRVATLDGGAVVNDVGYTDSDRTITLAWLPSASEDETIKRLVKLHDRVRLSTPHGLLECIIDSYTVRSADATLTLLPVSRLSE